VSKIKIAFIASTLEVGGAENVLFSLITRLPDDRYDTELYFLKDPGTVGDRIVERGVRFQSGFQRHRTDPTVLARLVRTLRTFSPDIFFSIDHHNAMFWGRIASLMARVPVRVVASHSTGRMETTRSFTAWDRLLMRHTDAVIALSEAHAAYLREVEEVDPGKIVIIENGIDTDRYADVAPARIAALRYELGVKESDRVVAMVAVLRPEKAHSALLDAARFIKENRPDLSIKFLVVGDGPERGRLEDERARLGLEDSVLLLGIRDDIPDLLHIAGAVALPSHPAVETLPLAVLEAMAAGTPVVASAVGSVGDIIEDGWNGKLIAPADAIGLSDAICHIFDEPQETKQIIERARETVRARYTVKRMMDKFDSLFQRLVK
jgi:glycosyltransferase involved in cell wall biosynthesis